MVLKHLLAIKVSLQRESKIELAHEDCLLLSDVSQPTSNGVKEESVKNRDVKYFSGCSF